MDKIGPSEKSKMVVMRVLNHEIGEIADHLHVSRNTIRRHLEQLREEAGDPGGCEEVVVRTLSHATIERRSAEELMRLY